jgi:hypothetical protein
MIARLSYEGTVLDDQIEAPQSFHILTHFVVSSCLLTFSLQAVWIINASSTKDSTVAR